MEDIMAQSLTNGFNGASYGSENIFALSKKDRSELIEYAREKFDALAPGNKKNAENVKSVHEAIFALKTVHGQIHDMWVLDSAHDTDPLNLRSNAEMQYELYKKAGMLDVYNKGGTEVYRSAGQSGLEESIQAARTSDNFYKRATSPSLNF